MTHDYSTIKHLQSAVKSISVINYNGQKCVIKIYNEKERPKAEASLMKVISMTGYAPEVVEYKDNYIIAKYIEGENFADKYKTAMMTDDERMLENLASRLCIFLQMFYTLNEGYILGKIDFSDFILVEDRCCCVSFSEAEKGLPFQDVAGVVAYAMCNAVGSPYNAYPFVKKALDCFHLTALDIINDMDGYLDKFSQESSIPVDKQSIRSVLMSFEDNGFDWEMISSQRSNE